MNIACSADISEYYRLFAYIMYYSTTNGYLFIKRKTFKISVQILFKQPSLPQRVLTKKCGTKRF